MVPRTRSKAASASLGCFNGASGLKAWASDVYDFDGSSRSESSLSFLPFRHAAAAALRRRWQEQQQQRGRPSLRQQ